MKISFALCFIVFPFGCSNYSGPHAIPCLKSIWDSVECLEQGYRHPYNLTMDEIAALRSYNIRFVLID